MTGNTNITIKKGNNNPRKCDLCGKELGNRRYLDYGVMEINSNFQVHLDCIRKIINVLKINKIKLDLPPYQRADGIMGNDQVRIGWRGVTIKSQDYSSK